MQPAFLPHLLGPIPHPFQVRTSLMNGNPFVCGLPAVQKDVASGGDMNLPIVLPFRLECRECDLLPSGRGRGIYPPR